jgi:ubiquinone/menaquinone biosynthesis C-methylase UbiE
MTTDKRLVLRVNELFHDLEEAGYEDVHPEIFQREQRRWEKIFDRFLPLLKSTKRTVLDCGTGTGFVSSLLLPRLSPGDTLVCSDISSKMLEVARDRLTEIREDVPMRFLKTEDETLPLADASVDMAMMNSVLHHVPETALFLKELRRILVPGGLLIIGHEPNASFFESRFLPRQAGILHHLTFKRIAALILKTLGLYNRVVPPAKNDPLLAEINKTLLQENLVEQPLDRPGLSALIDIHSPTAGSLHRDRGFRAREVLSEDAWEVLSLETYNHLLKRSGASRLLAPYEALLRWLFPHSGSTFFLVARKRG